MTVKWDEGMLDGLVAGCKTPEDVGALYTQMLQRVIDRSLSTELDAHLGYDRHDKASDGPRANTRNGSTAKRLKGTFGEIEVTTPRDRAGTFEPVLVKKRQTRLGEPPRLPRRLQLLRGWSDGNPEEEVGEVLAGST